ncbi:CinA family protein [Iodidimonas sp. SYSU 1G8]|uniref:CinA family protein n=1 Tax=Iodidimonas sp. SYSU 1G8 TaxID=3133967 RepID=UPI0031FF34E4
MNTDEMMPLAAAVLAAARAKGFKLAAAESCTGGLVMACLTEVPGSSNVVDRGFVTYSNSAKNEILGVPKKTLVAHGAVSEPVARAMAQGALEKSRADVVVAITGIAGPPKDDTDKSVGLVHFAAARRGGETIHRKMEFGDLGRSVVRRKSVELALELMQSLF